MINRAIRGGYSWELLVECIVLFAKSLLSITNTYKANVREYSPVTNYFMYTSHRYKCVMYSCVQTFYSFLLCKLAFSQESRCRVTNNR